MLKEIYENMSDEELLDRFKNIQDYQNVAREIMIEEARKRKLVEEDEIKNTILSLKSLDKSDNKSNKKEMKKTNALKGKLKWYHILIVFAFLNHTNITHLIAIGFDMMGFHSGYVFMLKTTYVLDFREKSALPTKLLADDYFAKKDYKNAQKYYSYAHTFAGHENRNKKIKNETELTALVGYTLSDLYLGNYSLFEDYEWQIVEFADANKNMIKGVTTYQMVYYFYHDVSLFYDKKKDYISSLKYLDKSEKFAPKHLLFNFYRTKGDLYFKLKNYEKAKEFYNKVLNFNRETFNYLGKSRYESYVKVLDDDKKNAKEKLKMMGAE